MSQDHGLTSGGPATPLAAGHDVADSWRWAAFAGLAAAVPTGAFLQAFTPLLPPLTGPGGFVAGAVAWGAHFALGAVLGVVYFALVERAPVRTYRRRADGRVALGLLYGAVLWATVGAVALPLTAAAVGLPAPDVPFWSPQSLAAHLIYGAVVGALATPA